jgi:hypothetical protein
MSLTAAENSGARVVDTEPNEVEARRCQVCGHQVPLSNWTLHEVRCARGACTCEHCGSRMHESELDAHWKTECPCTLVDCVYCELPVKRSDMEGHVRRCGARTERCEACGDYIRLIDRLEHELYICSASRAHNGESDASHPAKESVHACAGSLPESAPDTVTSTTPARRPLTAQGRSGVPSRKLSASKPWLLTMGAILAVVVLQGLRSRERRPAP